MRIEIIYMMWPNFRNVQIEKKKKSASYSQGRALHTRAVIACCVNTLAATNNLKHLEAFHGSHYLKKG